MSQGRVIAAKAAAGAGVLLVFALAAVLGVLLHLDTPIARRFVVARVNGALASTFEGTLTIDHVDRVGLDGLEGASVRARAPDGTEVLRAEGVRARASALAITWSALAGKGDIAIDIPEAVVDHADVNLDGDADGVPKLGRAFVPRRAPGPSPAPTSPGRGVRLAMPRVAITHAWVHGRALGLPPFDVDVDRLRGALNVSGERASIEVTEVGLRARGLPSGLSPAGSGRVRIDLPAGARRELALDASFSGAAGDVPLTASVKLDGPRLDATLDAPRVRADALRGHFPDLPLYQDGSVRAEAHGELPHLALSVDAAIGAGTVHGAGDLVLPGADTRATVSLDARGIDLRAFDPKAPPSSLAATARATLVAKPDGSASGTFSADVAPAVLGGARLPAATLSGDFARDGKSLALHGKGRIAEEGAPTDVTFTVQPDGLAFVARASVPRLERIARVGPVATGAATVTASGKLRFRDASIDATADADLRDVARGKERIEKAHLHARISGPVGAPRVDARLDGENATLEDTHYATVHLTARGPPHALAVQAELADPSAPEVTARAGVSVGAVTTIKDLEAKVRRGRGELAVRVGKVRISDGQVHVEDAVVEGLGHPAHATVHVTRDELVVRLRARGVAIGRVAHILGIQREIRHGHVDFDVDLVVNRQGANGHIVANVAGASLWKLDGFDAHANAQFEGRHVVATVHTTLADVGYADLKTTDLSFGEGPLTWESWKRGWGRVDLDADVDLGRLEALLPEAARPPARVAGKLVVKGTTARDAQTDMTPEVTLSLRTQGLAVGRPGSPSDRVSGVEAQLDLRIDGGTGAAEVSTRLVDGVGTIAHLDATSTSIPYRELFTPGANAAERLLAVPFRAKLEVPARPLAKLPAGFALDGVRGDVEAAADFEGTVRQPKLHVTGAARGVRAEDSPVTVPLDAELDALYDGAAADARFDVRARKATLLDGTAHVDARADDFLAGRGAWNGGARVRLVAFPLWSVAPLADRGVRGTATGVLVVEGVHTAPRAELDLDLAGLQLGTVTYKSAKLSAKAEGEGLHATARFDQGDGALQVETLVGTRWGTALVPALDEARPLEVSLEANAFRLAALQPFADTFFTELDGRVDAKVRLSRESGGKPKLSGTAQLQDGLVQLAGAGTELHGAKAKLTLAPDGTVRLDDVSAQGITGFVSGDAALHLDGFRLVDAKASVHVPKGQAIPVDVEGVQVGEVYGDLTATARAAAERKEVNCMVDVASLHVQLPLAAAHGVRDLDELPNVHVGMYAGNTFSQLALDAGDRDAKPDGAEVTQLNVAVRLREDVEIVRGTTLRVSLEGEPTVHVAAQTSVTGQVRLRGGTLEVQGKTFEIEKGTVTFASDPANPLVVVTAGWTAPDGTRVYADFAGPLKTGKVTLRSEPARPKNEILALIVFGNADDATQAQSSYAGASSAAAGGFATEGLSRGLDELTGLQVATKIDTSNAASPRPEVEVQIARSISLQIAFVLGTPPPGSNPDKTFATIDWRFTRQWSLQTTFGDEGSSFADIVWQYRY